MLRHLVEQGCPDHTLGARPLRSAVRRLVEEPLAEAILAGRFQAEDDIRARLEDGAVVFEKGGPVSSAG